VADTICSGAKQPPPKADAVNMCSTPLPWLKVCTSYSSCLCSHENVVDLFSLVIKSALNPCPDRLQTSAQLGVALSTECNYSTPNAVLIALDGVDRPLQSVCLVHSISYIILNAGYEDIMVLNYAYKAFPNIPARQRLTSPPSN